MVTFARGATPTITFELDDEPLEDELDLTIADHIYITFYSKNGTLTKQPDTDGVTEKTITVSLSQRETLSFPEGNVQMQINWTYDGGERWSSTCEQCLVTKQLLNKVVG